MMTTVDTMDTMDTTDTAPNICRCPSNQIQYLCCRPGSGLSLILDMDVYVSNVYYMVWYGRVCRGIYIQSTYLSPEFRKNITIPEYSGWLAGWLVGRHTWLIRNRANVIRGHATRTLVSGRCRKYQNCSHWHTGLESELIIIIQFQPPVHPVRIES